MIDDKGTSEQPENEQPEKTFGSWMRRYLELAEEALTLKEAVLLSCQIGSPYLYRGII